MRIYLFVFDEYLDLCVGLLRNKNQLGSYYIFKMDNQQGQYCRGQGTLFNIL